ncbi:MAG: sulfite exporter TauE/SafE family protein [Methanobacteriota archaeon]|nr:MAG: sulfite exporter TauE/SafE family protein [Euryarchaeota archaeon]
MDFAVLPISLLIFAFTTIMAVAGVGAAFIVIPLLIEFNYNILVAMTLGLLFNTISTGVSSIRHIRQKHVDFRVAIPVIIMSVIFTPVGSYLSSLIPTDLLKLLFGIALVLISLNIFRNLKRGQVEETTEKREGWKVTLISSMIGAVVGTLAGLLGIGGGAIILPFFLWVGLETKRAASTTSFIVIFSSFAGLYSKYSILSLELPINLVIGGIIATFFGALLGSYLMHFKLNRRQIKLVIAIMILLVGLKTIYSFF